MPWDADGGAADGLEVHAPSGLIAHRGYVLAFSEERGAPQNGSANLSSSGVGGNTSSRCAPWLQVSYLRPGSTRWHHLPAPQLSPWRPAGGERPSFSTLLAEHDDTSTSTADAASDQMNGSAYRAAGVLRAALYSPHNIDCL